MKLHDLVSDPSKLKTHKTHISPEVAYDRLKAGDKDPRLVNIVAQHPEFAYGYAKGVIRGRFPEGEPAIAKDPKTGYWYARDIIKGRWPEGEPAIAKDPEVAYFYARDVIKDRFLKGEPTIATRSWESYWYARNVIRGRFPEGEPAIKRTNAAQKYNDFINSLK